MDGLVHRIAIAGTNSLSCFPPFNEDLFQNNSLSTFSLSIASHALLPE
jgi:hypothetical protein